MRKQNVGQNGLRGYIGDNQRKEERKSHSTPKEGRMRGKDVKREKELEDIARLMSGNKRWATY